MQQALEEAVKDVSNTVLIAVNIFSKSHQLLEAETLKSKPIPSKEDESPSFYLP